MWLEAEDHSKPNNREEIHRMHRIREGMQIHTSPPSIRKSLDNSVALQGLRIPTGSNAIERPEIYDVVCPMLLQQVKGEGYCVKGRGGIVWNGASE